ncbi:hypothetical protein GGD65_000063 [Bradyrhizobium sp. CIR18]|nr:hypothetical protein [Bradyrhizobium sp. CIR3A]MBB4359065.1 hypothetical protein [Bradyrhizobium sp. CIR18]NYG42925.1 hypothetical protein [Bradyrhizobium sp. IAR9]
MPISMMKRRLFSRKFFGAESFAASCNLEDAGGTICRLRGLLLARGN